MQNNLKIALAIPAVAAMLLGATVLFPSTQLQAQAAESHSMSSGGGSWGANEQTIAVHIKSGNVENSDDLWSASMGLMLAQHMREQGRDVVVLLDVQGVNLGVATPKAELTEHAQMVQDFINTGGRVVVCEPCLNEAGYTVNDLAPGVEYNRPAKMSSILSGATIVVDY